MDEQLSEAPIQSELAGPVTPAERQASIDVLRGLAVLGILAMNIQSFAMIDAAYSNPTAYGDLHGANFAIWLFSYLFANMKFITIFSALFGAGIVLMAERLDAAGLPTAALHYRRMFWLLLFGAAHAYLLWYGDVLFIYALLGLVVYPCRRLPVWAQLVLGSLLVFAGGVLLLDAGLNMLHWRWGRVAAALYDWKPTHNEIQWQLDTYRSGWLVQQSHRFWMAFYMHLFLWREYFFYRIAGLMLLGMALYRLGLFSARRSSLLYAALVLLGALVGVPLAGLGVYLNMANHWNIRTGYFLYESFNYWGSLLVSLGWTGLVMLACMSHRIRPWLRPLCAVGRMALTNYLLQTIICTTLFYGHGFGLYGRVERTGQFGIVLAIWAFQLIMSPLWLHWFRFGPFEWLWRTLTYWKLQPMMHRRERPAEA